jgi:hypothetical protein
MRQVPQVEAAMGKQTLALLAALDTACTSVDDLGRAHRRVICDSHMTLRTRI